MHNRKLEDTKGHVLNSMHLWLTTKDNIDSINCITWSPTGSTLAFGGKDRVIRIWDAITNRTRHILDGHLSPIRSIAWSPDGQLLASGGNDGAVRLWDSKTGSLLRSLDGHQYAIYSITFSPDGNTIASAGYDKTIRLWHVQTGQLLRALHGHKDWIYSLSWSVNNPILASGAADGITRLWDIRNNHVIKEVSFTHSPIYSLAWSPNTFILALGSGDGATRIYDINSNKVIHSFRQEGSVRSIAWSQTHGNIIAAGSNNGTIKLWNTETNQTFKSIGNKRFELHSIAWSPDGKLLASGGEEETLRLWNSEKDEIFLYGGENRDQSSTMIFSPDGKVFAVVDNSHTVQLRNSETDDLLQSLKNDGTPVKSLGWSTNGKHLALGRSDGLVQLWDTSAGAILSEFKISDIPVNKLAWSADRITIALVTDEGIVSVLNTDTGDCQKIFTPSRASQDIDISFSPDGMSLVLNEEGQTIRIWDKQTSKIGYLTSQVPHSFYFQEAISQSALSNMFAHISNIDSDIDNLRPTFNPSFIDYLEPTFNSPFELDSNKEKDFWKNIHHDIPDIRSLIEELRITAFDQSNLELSLHQYKRAAIPDKSNSWFKGGKKVDKGHYVPKKQAENFLITTPLTHHPKRPRDIYFDNKHYQSRFYGLTSPKPAYLSNLITVYKSILGIHDWELRSQPSPAEEYRDWPPVMDVEGYYYRLKRKHNWHIEQRKIKQDRIHGTAWSPIGNQLAVGTKNGVIEIWDVKSRRLSQRLEGHNSPIIDLMWSNDGQILASHSNNSIRLWRCDTWATVSILKPHALNHQSFGISLHQTSTTPVTLMSGGVLVYSWDFDTTALLSITPDSASVHYTSAKIVIIGESNVGKSCLALRLTEDRYAEQGTTHGMRIWSISPDKLDPKTVIPPGEKRDVILWDMGGQDEYRLVHQLFLHDTTIALILLDPTRGRTAFNEVEGWNLRLEKQVGERQATKLLVGTKMEGKHTVIDNAGLKRLISDCKFKGFYPTSAKTKKGINKLRKAISSTINWEALVRASRPTLFQLVRDEIDRRQRSGEVVLLFSDLEDRIQRLTPDQFDIKAINSVVEQLALQGMVTGTRLASGERVLVLQISEIERYAGSLIIAARNNPRGVPALEEQMIASSKMSFPGIKEKERLHKFQERIVLECVIQLLLEHGICLKHEGLLIFPSLFEPVEKEEMIEPHHSISLYYDFSGAIDNIYSSLIVRLAISAQFGRVRLWENRAEFAKAEQGVCGLHKIDHRSGLAHLDLFFSEDTSVDVRDLFTVFIEEHLRKEGVNITEIIEVTCICGYRFQETSLRKRLAQGYGDIICPECEVRNHISEGAQKARSSNSEMEEKLLALKTIIYEKSREAIISTKVTFMESAYNQSQSEPIRILHLSDLHINSEDDPISLVQPLIRDLEDPRGGLGFEQLNYLVISGDLTNRATSEEFEQAYQFISSLIDRFKLTAERCIIVPGNHDLSWDRSVYDWKQKRLLDVNSLKVDSYLPQGEIFLVRNENKYPARFENFAKFYHSLTQLEYPIRAEEQYIPILFDDTHIQFLTMNSAWEIDEFFPKRSSINESALSRGLERAGEQIKRAKEENRLTTNAFPLRIAVLHHPVMGNEQIISDAFLERLQQEDFHICLHGHIHEERLGIIGPPDPIRNIHIIGAGSLGAPVYARPESVPRLYNLIEVTPTRDKIRVHTRSMSKKGGAWRGWAAWPTENPTERRTYYDIELSDFSSGRSV